MKLRTRSIIILMCIVITVSAAAKGISVLKKRSVSEKTPTDENEDVPAYVSTSVEFDPSISYEDGGVSSLLKEFNDKLYRCLAELKEEDLTYFFASPGGYQALRTQGSLSTLIASRLVRPGDLRMVRCDTTLYIGSISESAGKTVVTAYEKSECFFAMCPAVSSQSADIRITFELDSNDKLTAYEREDDFFSVVDAAKIDKEGASGNIKTAMDAARISWIDKLRNSMTVTEKQRADIISGRYPEDIACDHRYDRVSAFRYASTYVFSRNASFLDFTTIGGNCQNYASQVMRSGGIPNDTEGDFKWKYFDDSYDTTSAQKGRTPSWTASSSFADYAKGNTGYGLCCDTGVNMYALEAGDLIIMEGIDGDYVHTMVVIAPAYDKEGNIVDMLVDSNSTNRRNYPLSACLYSSCLPVRIYGWNDYSAVQPE
ncbi:MAG: amidase domain-containing protein [Eubacteriaceae bacterium]|nr:amidase domain-containing protein [Eubacteriaceae bacterium]